MRHISRWSSQSPVCSAFRNCRLIPTIFRYCIQSDRVLDVGVLEKDVSFSSNVRMIGASIVHVIASSCVPFTNSTKACRESFKLNSPSFKDYIRLQSKNLPVKYPCSTAYINICALVALDISFPFNMAFILPSA